MFMRQSLTIAMLSIGLGAGGAAQAAAGRQQRDGLHQIGLAGAIVADQHHMARVELHRHLGVVSEIAELELENVQVWVTPVLVGQLPAI